MNPIRKIGIAFAGYQPDVAALAAQLESIRRQSFESWVCVLSFDSPWEELARDPRLAPVRADPRMVWCGNSERLGPRKNFERAIGRVLESGGVDAIACSDQDDLWDRDKLAKCAAALERCPPMSLVHSDLRVSVSGRPLERTAWQLERRGVAFRSVSEFLLRNTVTGAAMLMDAELARRYPVIPEAAPMHDHWYALAASAHGGAYPLPEALGEYRQHGENVIGVVPFDGMLSVPAGNSPLSVLRKCRRGWTESRRLALAAQAAGMPLDDRARRLFLGSWDLGLGLLSLGLQRLHADPPLARAALIRGVGKLLSN